MSYVTPQSQSLKVAFSSRYSLPRFQREYKWETRHFQELVDDIQTAFLQEFDPTHGRAMVADYVPYFLGSIITAADSAGKKALVDGQQRLTSAFVLLAYFHRYVKDNDVSSTADLSNYLGNISFGVRDYPIEFSDARKAIFDLYLDTANSVDDALDKARSITGLDQGDQRLLDALSCTEQLLNHSVLNHVEYFVDFLTEKVVLIDISVAKESEAHRVFVTMNDRGLRLGPIDLLKGEVLSRITTKAEMEAAHRAWVETISVLRLNDPEGDSLFFRHLFRAQWGNTIRGKSRGDAPGDYDMIGDGYHRWFVDNVARIGLSTSDDYLKFARDTVPAFAHVCAFIREAESVLKPGFEHIFYNDARRYSFQSMVLLAAVSPADQPADWKQKIALVSRLIDLILTTRIIEGKENNYDNLKEISFSLTKELRGKDVAGIVSYVKAQWGNYDSVLPSLANLSYQKGDRSNLLYILARLGCFLEDAYESSNKVGFETYWRRDKGTRTFDVEHLLKKEFNAVDLPAAHGFADAREYGELRNKIGALVLLPRSRNRSLQDKPYREKAAVYATEGALAQTLGTGLYTNNPKVAAFIAKHPSVKLMAISDFGKDDIEKRADSYVELAKLVWASP